MGCSANSVACSKNTNTTFLKNGTIIISIKNFVIQNTDAMRSHYKPICKISNGDFAKVFTVTHLHTNTQRIMKIISIDLIKASILSNPRSDPTNYEVFVLAGIDHPNIQKVYEYFTDDNYYYIILEYVDGKSILEYIIRSYSNITEATIARYFKQIISSLVYLHKYNYVYGNINDNNIIVMNNKEQTIKLTGFSLIKQLPETGKNNFITKIVNSSENKNYISPEMIIYKRYNTASDIWACGVLLYKLITGVYPNININDKISLYKETNEFKALNSHLQDMITKMLTIDDSQRITADKLINHPWFNLINSSSNDNNKNIHNENNSLAQLGLLNNLSQEKLKTATEAYIIHQMANNKLIDKLRQQFMLCDKSCDGLISRNELKQMLTSFDKNHYTELEIDELMNEIDQDKSGEISFEEFMRVMINYETILTKQNLQNAFNFFDKDKTGTLSVHELKDIFSSTQLSDSVIGANNEAIDKYISELLDKYDTNKDGQLSFDEFVNLMNYK